MRSTLRIMAAALLALLFADAANAATVPGRSRLESPLTRYGYAVTLDSQATAGIYTLGEAFTLARLDFERASAFSGALYECSQPGADQGEAAGADSDGDGDLSDEAGCNQLVALNASVQLSSLSSGKEWYVLDIDTPETSGQTSRLTVKGSFDDVSATYGETGDEALLAYIYGMERFNPAALTYEGGRKVYYFSQGTGGLIPTTGNDANEGTWAEPKLTCAEMENLVASVEGVEIRVDSGDGAWVDGGASGNCPGLLNNLVPFCDTTKGACAVVGPIDPHTPFTIDASGASAGERVVFCTTDADDGDVTSIVIENLAVTGAAAGVQGIQNERGCNIVGLNLDLSITANGSDSVVESNGEGGVFLIGNRTRLEVLAASTGVNNWPIHAGTSGATDDPFVGVIAQTSIEYNGGTGTEQGIFMTAGSSGDFFGIGPTVTSTAGPGLLYGMELSQNGGGELQRARIARMLFHDGTGVSNGAGIRATTTAANEGADIQAAQITVDDFHYGVWLAGSNASDSTLLFDCLDCLVDATTFESLRNDGTGVGTQRITFQGVVDEDDQTVTWELADTDYNTTALAQAGYDADVFAILTNDASGDLGGTGSTCGYREDTCGGGNDAELGVCSQSRECRTLGPRGTYYLPIPDSFGLRYVVPGVTITGFQLDRGVIGAH